MENKMIVKVFTAIAMSKQIELKTNQDIATVLTKVQNLRLSNYKGDYYFVKIQELDEIIHFHLSQQSLHNHGILVGSIKSIPNEHKTEIIGRIFLGTMGYFIFYISLFIATFCLFFIIYNLLTRQFPTSLLLLLTISLLSLQLPLQNRNKLQSFFIRAIL